MPTLQAMHRALAKHPMLQVRLFLLMDDLVHWRVEEVFSPIFFHYPNGLKDRSVWEPRDTNKYIRQWYELASMRTWVASADMTIDMIRRRRFKYSEPVNGLTTCQQSITSRFLPVAGNVPMDR